MTEECHADLKYIIDFLKDAIERKTPVRVGTERGKRLYDTEAYEFLAYCRQDINDASERGRTNALSNAKRAIECRADEILTLLNLRGFATKHKWGIPYKLEVLKSFGLSAPDVLRSYITSKRNILEHEYVKPKTAEEIQYIADITELFLSASDNIVKKGYITSIGFTNKGKSQTEPIDKWNEKWLRYEDEYSINFDLEKETVVFTHKQVEHCNEYNKRTHWISSGPSSIISEETTSIPLHDCKEAEIKGLMQIIINASV